MLGKRKASSFATISRKKENKAASLNEYIFFIQTESGRKELFLKCTSIVNILTNSGNRSSCSMAQSNNIQHLDCKLIITVLFNI